jgi:hypothetical protein
MTHIKSSITDNYTPGVRSQMGGRRKKGGALPEQVQKDEDKKEEDAKEEDYDAIDKIPNAKDETMTANKRVADLAVIAEEGRGGPEQYDALRMEEGYAGLPSMDIKGGNKRRKSKRRKLKSKRRKGTNKKTKKNRKNKSRRK